MFVEKYVPSFPYQALLQKYHANPSRAAFQELFDGWRPHVQQAMKGCVGNYIQKVILDVMVLSGWISQGHLVAWPTGCPGYQKGVA